MEPFRYVSEGVARKTTRRGLFGRGAEVIFGALAGAAAGTITRPGSASAGIGTTCDWPGGPCPCDGCTDAGPCAKPCVFVTTWYASGCWVSLAGATCCDCDCGPLGDSLCGCTTDYHAANCP